MQNKYTIARTISLGISIMFGILLLPPFHQATAGIVLCDSFVGSGSISTFCNDPFGGVDQTSQQLQLQNQLSTLQQTQSNQATENRLKLQYGYASYSKCMPTNFDAGNQYSVAIHLRAAESCMVSYKSTQEAKTQCSAGYVYFNGSCVSGAQGCLNSWGVNSIWTGTGCACASGYKWDSSKDKCATTTPTCTADLIRNGVSCRGGECPSGYHRVSDSVCDINVSAPATTPTCTANATFNGSQCVCSSGFDWNSGQTACVKTVPVVVPTVNQIIKNNPVTPSASNGISKVAVRVNNSTSTEATTTRPTIPQKGFFSRLLHALNPFSWF